MNLKERHRIRISRNLELRATNKNKIECEKKREEKCGNNNYLIENESFSSFNEHGYKASRKGRVNGYNLCFDAFRSDLFSSSNS